ncbi:MAG: EF-hand domain-containing protein [Geminicoccaceae bacterium]|nr:EF-hand domain-containing protein [Geminicoccaceae bacterium]
MAGCRHRPPVAAAPARAAARAVALAAAFLAGCTDAPEPPVAAAPVEAVAPPEPLPATGEAYRARDWQERTRETFRQLDRNRDGKLDLSEVRGGFAVLDVDGGGFVSRHEALRLVEAGDRNRDGRLSRAELEALAGLRLESDRDGDGLVSALEFSLARTDEFVRADLDRDGRLVPEEWRTVPRFTLFRF